MKIGDRVQTAQGKGVVVKAWTETTWAFAIPKRQAWFSVKLEGPEGHISVFGPGELEVIAPEKSAP